MADIIQQVKNKMKVIEGLRRDKAEQDGQKTQLFKQLKEVSGMTSIDTAVKKSEELSLELIEHERIFKILAGEMDQIISGAKND